MHGAAQFPTGSQIIMKGGRRRKVKGCWCMQGGIGGWERNWWLLVSVNLKWPLTVFKDWLTVLWLNMLSRAVSCPVLKGTASFLPWQTPLPYSPHLQATSRSLSFQHGRPCQNHRRDVSSGSFAKAGKCFSAWTSCVGEMERRELKLRSRPNEHQQLSGIFPLLSFSEKKFCLKSMEQLQKMVREGKTEQRFSLTVYTKQRNLKHHFSFKCLQTTWILYIKLSNFL